MKEKSVRGTITRKREDTHLLSSPVQGIAPPPPNYTDSLAPIFIAFRALKKIKLITSLSFGGKSMQIIFGTPIKNVIR